MRRVSGEADLIRALRALAHDPAARGLADDAAVLDWGGKRLVLTHDMLVESVHFLPDDPPESVAWKLLAVNLSDLAAKGARPLGALMGYSLRGDAAWDAAFVRGLAVALDHFGVPLLGGDTVRAPSRMLGLTLLGEATGSVPDRRGANMGDALFVTGSLGDAALGLSLLQSGATEPVSLIEAYRLPMPQLEAGALISVFSPAMMDVSDGLLIDAARMAEASQVGIRIDLDAIPLSPAFTALAGQDRQARLAAATGGDDYQLLFVSGRPLPALPCPVTRIGQIVRGSSIQLYDSGGEVPLPDRLGWEHH